MSFKPMDGGPKVPGVAVEASVKVPDVKVSGALGGVIGETSSGAPVLPDLGHVAGGITGQTPLSPMAGATPGIIGGSVPNLGEAAGSLAGGALGNIGGAGGGSIGTLTTGIAGGQLPDVRGIAGGIAGGAIGNAVAGFAGGTLGGGVGDIAGGAIGGAPNLGGAIGGIASGAIGGAVGGIVDKAVTGAVGKIAGDFVGNLTGDLAGGLAGAISGGAIGAALSGALDGPKAKLEAITELPEFPDIAVTAADPKKLIKSAVAKAEGALGRVVKNGARKLADKNFAVKIASGDKLDVRQFSIHERLSSLFQVNLVAVSDNPSIEFDDVVGQPAKFSMSAGMHDKFWSGVCNHFEQVRHEPGGLSTYQFSIVPKLWFLTQRKNYRMHQQISEPDIVLKMLKEWDIKPVEQYDKGAYKKRKYRVQYNESDYSFLCRMLEDAGITFYFQQGGEETELVLSDAPHSNPPRGESLAFKDDTSLTNAVDMEFVTGVRMGQRVRPGKYTMRDHDYRKPPTYKLVSEASKGLAIEEKLERFQYVPGAFLFGADSGEATPSADDKGKTRTDEKEAAILSQKRLDAKRGSARTATFETNAHDLGPGVVMSIQGHAHGALGEDKKLLVVESSLSGTTTGEWSQHCEVRGTETPFRPELVTPRPKTQGMESATVVGPPGEEIHCDEFGRVRCHFHWDRESKMDDNSSCWIHVSQPWGGAGYGGTALPRVGQEVLVDFLGGDPDRPVIVGRLYTNLQKTPYKLPDNKTQTGIKSNSTGGGGGYNELMFEDAAGKELVNIQAQRNLNKLVKNDETVAIGHDRTKQVGHDDALKVGNNRSAVIGAVDSALIGQSHIRTIAQPADPPPTIPPTGTAMSDKNITQTTGQATLAMAGPDVNLTAAGNISISAGANISISAVGGIKVNAGTTIESSAGILISNTAGVQITTTAGAIVNVKAGAIATLESPTVQVKGAMVEITASGPVDINGAIIDLN